MTSCSPTYDTEAQEARKGERDLGYEADSANEVKN